MKRTLSMRKTVDPREIEMMEKCDLADAVERMQFREKKAELDKVEGFAKIWPIIKSKWMVYVGVFFLFMGQLKLVSTGMFMG